MKKKISLLLAVVLIVSAMCMTGAAAADTTGTTTTATTSIGSSVLTVKYNGGAVTFPDAQPFVDENNRTLIPVRFVAETMGAKVDWDQTTQTAIIAQNDITINVPIDSDTLTVTENGNTTTVKMDTAAVCKDNRTFVPIRYVAQSLGAWVGYSDLFNTVQIYKDVLTPAEITRLQAYHDKTWSEVYPNSTSPFSKTYPQDAYMSGTGTYGFENANEWIQRNPIGKMMSELTGTAPTTFSGYNSGGTFTYGKQADIDCSKFALDEARAYIKSINTQYGDKIKLSFRSDLSCVFWSRHLGEIGIGVRGIITLEIPSTATQADISWIEKNLPFTDCHAGDKATLDAEVNVGLTESIGRVVSMATWDITQ